MKVFVRYSVDTGFYVATSEDNMIQAHSEEIERLKYNFLKAAAVAGASRHMADYSFVILNTRELPYGEAVSVDQRNQQIMDNRIMKLEDFTEFMKAHAGEPEDNDVGDEVFSLGLRGWFSGGAEEAIRSISEQYEAIADSIRESYMRSKK